MKHMFIQYFTMAVDWPKIARLMEVSIMFNICRCCLFTWYFSISDMWRDETELEVGNKLVIW